jgi:hypothetical protein
MVKGNFKFSASPKKEDKVSRDLNMGPTATPPMVTQGTQNNFNTLRGHSCKALEVAESLYRDFFASKDTELGVLGLKGLHGDFRSFEETSLIGIEERLDIKLESEEEKNWNPEAYWNPRFDSRILESFEKVWDCFIDIFFNVALIGCLDYPENGIVTPEFEDRYKRIYEDFIHATTVKIFERTIEGKITILGLLEVFLEMNELLLYPSVKYREFLKIGKKIWSESKKMGDLN